MLSPSCEAHVEIQPEKSYWKRGNTRFRKTVKRFGAGRCVPTRTREHFTRPTCIWTHLTIDALFPHSTRTILFLCTMQLRRVGAVGRIRLGDKCRRGSPAAIGSSNLVQLNADMRHKRLQDWCMRYSLPTQLQHVLHVVRTTKRLHRCTGRVVPLTGNQEANRGANRGASTGVWSARAG